MQVWWNIGVLAMLPDGLAHLPPGRARRQNHHSTKVGKVRQRTSAEGGQVEPVLGAEFYDWSTL
jgi:hypothetical protein